MKIPVLDLKPAIDELRPEIDAAYHRVMESGRVILGAELEAFESEYARWVGVRHAVGVGNGLEALQMILMASGVGPGDEVIVPSNGYIATWLAVTHAGAQPVPSEPDPQTYNLDPARLPSALTSKTKAILPIHLYGQPADMKGLSSFAAQNGLLVVEDAAQAHGAKCRGHAVGALGHAAAFSFYPSKNLGALADAGAVTTDDDALAEKLRHLRNYGAKIRYQNEYLGMNSRLGELQAAFLRVKLLHLEAWNTRRVRLARRYREQLRGVGDLVLPHVPEWAQPVWHLFAVRTAHRDPLREHLAAGGIGTQVHYPTPPHLSRAYRGAGWEAGAFPIAERLSGEVLSLPLGPHLALEQVDCVCEAIREFFATSV